MRANVLANLASLQRLLRRDREMLPLQRIRCASYQVQDRTSPRRRRTFLKERRETLRERRGGSKCGIPLGGDAELQPLALVKLWRGGKGGGGEACARMVCVRE